MSKPKEPSGPRYEPPRIEVRNPRYEGKTPEQVARKVLRLPRPDGVNASTLGEGGSRKGGRSER